MNNRIELIPSGISVVDDSWGGLYRGGTYLLLGPRKSGRTLLSLQFARKATEQKELCLYFTTMRPKDLMIHAASINFDLQQSMNSNQVILIRVAPPTEEEQKTGKDIILSEYLHDIVTVVEQYHPNKIIFDDLTPFVNFDDVDSLEETFLATTESIEENGITSLFVLGEPATPSSRIIADTIINSTTGYIHLQKKEENAEQAPEGKITITPNIGHTEGQFSSYYAIEPYKGVVMDKKIKKRGGNNNSSVDLSNYTPVHKLEILDTTFHYSNIYNVDDFKLLLNNQIAMFKSTGQLFTLISIRLAEEAENRGLLTLSQLKNAVRLASDKKDKICVITNKVITLLTKDDKKNISSFISNVTANLPSQNKDYIERIQRYLSVCSITVNENYGNAEEMIDELLNDPANMNSKHSSF